MSYAMKIAKAEAMGDPGWLGNLIGGIGRVVGAVVPGPIGAIARLGTRLFAGSTPATGARPIKLASVGARPGIGLTNGGPMVPFPGLPGVRMPLPGGGFGIRGNETQAGSGGRLLGGAPIGPPAGGACTAGFHWNRTAYFTKRYGLIEKGTVCVRNRKRNPLNPRALSRAMARLTSAKRAARCLADYSIRPRKACGCR